jgi:hypothetical protein
VPPITKEVLVGYSSYWLRALLLLRAAPACKPCLLVCLLTRVVSCELFLELALTLECRSDLLPGAIRKPALFCPYAYASKSCWVCPYMPNSLSPHRALQLLLRRGAVAGYLELGLYSLYAPLGLCYL